MGLDMYLTEEIYIGGYYEHNEVSGSINLTKKGKEINIPIDKLSYTILQVGYWRKANAIHGWFVENVQDGVDNCAKYYVSVEQLQTLLDVCKTIKKEKEKKSLKKVEELLPTQSGFFFGSTQYDEWYWEDIDRTIEILTEALKNKSEFSDFYYEASW